MNSSGKSFVPSVTAGLPSPGCSAACSPPPFWPPPPSSSSSPHAANTSIASTASSSATGAGRKPIRLIAFLPFDIDVDTSSCRRVDQRLEQPLLTSLAQAAGGRQVLHESEDPLRGEGERGDCDRACHDAL